MMRIFSHFLTEQRCSYADHVILFVIILRAILKIPYPTAELNVHEIYDIIANDDRNIAILEAPIGGYGDVGMYSNESYQYYQTVHGKPLIGGFEVHVPLDTQRSLESYFLNQE